MQRSASRMTVGPRILALGLPTFSVSSRDGLALFDEVRQLHPSLSVILLTAHGTIPDAVEATARGVFTYLTKPYDAKELLEKETLDHNQLATIFAKVKKLPERPVWKSNPKRPVSTKGPIKVPARIALDSDASTPAKSTAKTKPAAQAKPAVKAQSSTAVKPAAKRTKPAAK